MLNPPGPAFVPSLHVVPSAPTPTSVAATPSDEYHIGAGATGAAGAAAGVAGVGAAIAVPEGAGEVGVGEGGEVGRGGRREWPGGTLSPGVTGGGPDSPEASRRGGASRVATPRMNPRYRPGFDWSIFHSWSLTVRSGDG